MMILPNFDFVSYKVSSFHRLLSYFTVALMVVAYHFFMAQWQNIVLFPIISIIFYLVNSLIPNIKYNKQYHFLKFVLDCLFIILALYFVQFNLIITFFAFVAFFFSLSFQHYYLIKAFILGVILSVIGLSQIHIPMQQHWQVLNPLLLMFYYLQLGFFISIAGYIQVKRIQQLKMQSQSYFEQMTHYINFANQLSRYAPTQLWKSIILGQSEAKIEYKRKKLTILFSDIKGFTQLSESLMPEDLAYLLNEYLSHMITITRRYNATIDKFMGDGMLIFFGDIDSQGVEQDAKNCVNMAMEMRQQMEILRQRWQEKGYPALYLRMGITSGYCHVGNYGTTEHMAYTIIGREANLAARIQSYAEINEVLISDSTYQLIQDEFYCIEKPAIELKGINQPIRTWQVVSNNLINDDVLQLRKSDIVQ